MAFWYNAPMPNDHISRTVAVYDTIAKEYADEIENYAPLKELTAFTSLVPKGRRVLDVGCAAGRDSFYLASKGYKVIGIDLSEELLKIARKRGSHVDFQKQDMRKLKFGPASFDGIWASAAILHLKREEVPSVLKQFHEILKPDGVLFISVKEGEGEADVVEKLAGSLRRHFTYFKLAELKQLLSKAGFTVTRIFSSKKRPRHPDQRDLSWISCFAKK